MEEDHCIFLLLGSICLPLVKKSRCFRTEKEEDPTVSFLSNSVTVSPGKPTFLMCLECKPDTSGIPGSHCILLLLGCVCLPLVEKNHYFRTEKEEDPPLSLCLSVLESPLS